MYNARAENQLDEEFTRLAETRLAQHMLHYIDIAYITSTSLNVQCIQSYANVN